MTLKRSPFKPAAVSAGKREIKCKVCRHPFIKSLPNQKVCSADCAGALAVSDRLKQERKAAKQQTAADRAQLETLRPRKWWLAKAKLALHSYIRARDEGKPCISCDTLLVKRGAVGGDYDAGHFRSVGSAKHLEFVEENIHGQCKRCNDYLKGNQIEYERRLRLRYGDAYVDAIKADQQSRNLTIDDFKVIEVRYKLRLKALKEGGHGQ